MTKILTLVCIRYCAGSSIVIFLSNPVNIFMFLQIGKLKQELLCNLSGLISSIEDLWIQVAVSRVHTLTCLLYFLSQSLSILICLISTLDMGLFWFICLKRCLHVNACSSSSCTAVKGFSHSLYIWFVSVLDLVAWSFSPSGFSKSKNSNLNYMSLKQKNSSSSWLKGYFKPQEFPVSLVRTMSFLVFSRPSGLPDTPHLWLQ